MSSFFFKNIQVANAGYAKIVIVNSFAETLININTNSKIYCINVSQNHRGGSAKYHFTCWASYFLGIDLW